jgi:Flp pilus assembly protein TadG
MFRALFKDRSGASAVEFAFVAPILAAVVALGWSTWQGERGVEQAKTGLRAGALYYTAGGTVDSVAQAVVMNAWSSAPANATASAVRSCYCAGVVTDCTLPCGVGQVRTVYVTLSASGSGQGVFGDQTLSQQEVVRVQ